MQKKLLAIVVSFFLLSVFVFNSSLYWILFPKIGSGWAYVIDQLYIFLIGIIVLLYFEGRENVIRQIYNNYKKNKNFLLLLWGFGFVVHFPILNFFFFGEEPTSILSAVTYNDSVKFVNVYRGYHFAPYVLLFLLFGTNTLLINISILLLFIIVITFIYFFVLRLTNNTLTSFVTSLFFVSTPVYLDMFTWQSNSSGTLFALICALISMIYLLRFQKDKNEDLFFLSILFYMASIKISFVRLFGFVIVPIFLIFFSQYNRIFSYSIKIILSFAFLFILFNYIFIQYIYPTGALGKLYNSIIVKNNEIQEISVKGGDHLYFSQYPEAFITYISYIFFPNQIAHAIYPPIKFFLFPGNNTISVTLIIGNFFFLILNLVGIIGLFKFKKMYGKIFVLGALIIISNIFYIPFFVSTYHNPLIIDADFVRIDPGSGPGIRYVAISAIGLSLIVGTVFSLLINSKVKINRYFGIFSYGILIIINVILIRNSYSDLIKNLPFQKELPEHIFSLVPNTKEKKILFSSNPSKNSIEKKLQGYKWLYSFYNHKYLLYINNKEFLQMNLGKNRYKPGNIFSFYNNPYTHSYFDTSNLLREKLYGSNIQKNIQLLKSKVNIDSEIVPDNTFETISFRIKKGIYAIDNIDYRFIFPKKIHIILEKNDGGIKSSYIDYVNSSENVLDELPITLWALLQNVFIPNKNESNNLLINNTVISNFNYSTKEKLYEIVTQQDAINEETKISASNILMDGKITSRSLNDNWYIRSYPYGENDFYFRASENNVHFVFTFLSQKSIGRIVMFSPFGFDQSKPQKLKVFDDTNRIIATESDMEIFQDNRTNHDIYSIKLQNNSTKFLKLVINSTVKEPLVVDEIVLDPVDALGFSPVELLEAKDTIVHYIDDERMLFYNKNTRINSLGIIYACAENSDWNQQKKIWPEILPGIWKGTMIPLTSNNKEYFSEIDCYGSILKKIFIVGPMYPTKINISSVFLE